MRCSWIIGLWVLVAGPVFAQSEQALRQAFEGTTVRVKIDMPATSKGIDVRPGQEPLIDFTRLGNLMKREGTSIRAGESVLVTRARVRKTTVELQLAGGGYGTIGDMLNSSSTSSAETYGNSGHEKQLEGQIRAEANPARKKALERELRDERNRRNSDNARASAEANLANELRASNIFQQKLHGGSRFNLRFKDAVPAEYLTPDGVRTALAAWVDFDNGAASPAATDGGAPGDNTLRKGLTLADVERMLGPATSATEKREGALVVQERTYRRGAETIATRFVSGVLIEYSISSK